MYERTKKFATTFSKQYEVVSKLPPSGGALLTKVSVKPALVFEMLEVIFGPYEDLFKGFKFVDDKVTWHRFFKTKAGILSVYDFKGGTSIGNASEVTEALRKEADEFKEALEKAALIYPEIRRGDLKDEIKQDPIRNFTRTFLATYRLLQEAREARALLEGLVLYASIIDAYLRYGIILSRQIKLKVKEYDKSLVFQSGSEYISERTIHKLALEEDFISNEQFEEISIIYEFRNRAVHRYFISDFEYKELPPYLDRFEAVREEVLNKIIELEHKQVEEGVGMTTSNDIAADAFSRRVALAQEHLKIDSDLDIAVVPARKHLFPREHGPNPDTREIEE